MLILIPGSTGRGLLGPEIRGWELSWALSEAGFEVTVATPAPPETDRGLRRIDFDRATILREAWRHDVVMAPWIPPYLMPIAAMRRAVLVADLYDPVELELANLDTPEAESKAEAAERLVQLQLRFGDVIACGGVRQRDALLARLAPRRPHTPVVVVPFGLPAPPPPSPDDARRPLRSALGLSDDHVVVLWWGTVWSWFDYETAIRAVAELSKEEPLLTLVFTAGPPPRDDVRMHLRTSDARALADQLGVLGGAVRFLDTWVPYEDRHLYLADADVGLTLHADPLEAELAVRARYLDYLWSGLPCVLSKGDEMAESLAAAGLATLVDAGDVAAAMRALAGLAGDSARRERAGNAGREEALRYQWSEVVVPLAEAIESAAPPSAARRAAPAGAGALKFYARKLG